MLSLLVTPPPPPRNRFVSGDLVVSKTDPTDRRRILRVVNDSTVYETSRVENVDANYTYENAQSGGKRKTRRSRRRKCKNKSRKNHKKPQSRRNKSSFRR